MTALGAGLFPQGGTIWAYLFRTGGNVTAKMVQHSLTEYGVLLQNDEVKMITKMGNRAVYIGLSVVFKGFPAVIILNDL